MHPLDTVSTKIIDAKKQFCRESDEIILLAVSKTRTAEEIRQMFEQGQTCFGENYVQEILKKQPYLQDCQIEWHFIGQLQSNKAKLIANQVSWVQSVASCKLASKLNQHRAEALNPLNVLIQLNHDQEPSKNGLQSLDEVIDVANHIQQCRNLRLRGIMSIPAAETSVERQRHQFSDIYQYYLTLKNKFETIDTLSMGMSGDMSAAIAEGTTMVRIGTALFGARNAN